MLITLWIFPPTMWKTCGETSGGPMAKAIWSGAVSFGMVNIPVKLYGATESKDISFHLLHSTCGTRLKQMRWCPTDEDEIRQAPEVELDRVRVSDRELDMAFTLIELLRKPFDPEEYHDHYREALQ